MMLIKTLILVVAAVSFLFVSGCSNSTSTGAELGRVIYSNSFESSADTVGWTGYGERVFRNDAPPDGGRQSLYVSGGCVVPHAQFRIGVVTEGGNYVIRCWGKNLSNGGAVGLGFSPSPFAETAGISVVVSDSVWTSYTSSDSLYCPAGSNLWIWMISGGFVGSAMLVDRIEVVRVG